MRTYLLNVQPFLLNEKRSAIESIEKRLDVDIVILPSKHLETPAYAIDRIREREAGDDKPSYVQIRAEDITIPEFAQQLKPKAEKAIVKEFLHDTPAPAPIPEQNKAESGSLIKRFWHKLVGDKPEKTKQAAPSAPKPRVGGAGNNQQGRNNRRDQQTNREGTTVNRPPRNQQPRDNRTNRPPRGQEQRAAAPMGPRPPQQNRQQQPGNRNERPPRAPTVVDEISNRPSNIESELVSPVLLPEILPTAISENDSQVVNTDEPMANAGENKARPEHKRNGSRRGPNRRRPRNPNYKRPDAVGSDEGRPEGGAEVQSYDIQPTPASNYASDFANRRERPENSSDVSTAHTDISPNSPPKPDISNES